MAKSTNENYVPRYARGGKLSKDDAIIKALKMGVDFDKDFHSQSFGNELSELAKESGYRKSKSSSGSLGRAFFEHLERIYDKNKSYYDDMANDKYSWGGGIAVGSILGGYLGYKIGRARPQQFGFETEKSIGRGIKKTFSKKKKMEMGGEVVTTYDEAQKSLRSQHYNATRKEIKEFLDKKGMKEVRTKPKNRNEYSFYAKGGEIEYDNDENEAVGTFLLNSKDGKEILSKSKNAEQLESQVRKYHSTKGIPNWDFEDDEDEGIDWVTFGDLYEVIKANKYAKGGGVDKLQERIKYQTKFHEQELADLKRGKRKTINQYFVQGNYGYGFEDLSAHNTRAEANMEKRTYDENESYPHRVVTKRIKKADFESGNYADGEVRKRKNLKSSKFYVYSTDDNFVELRPYKENNKFDKIRLSSNTARFFKNGIPIDELKGINYNNNEELVEDIEYRISTYAEGGRLDSEVLYKLDVLYALNQLANKVELKDSERKQYMEIVDYMKNNNIKIPFRLKLKYAEGGEIGMNDFGVGDKVVFETYRDGMREGEILREIDDRHFEIGSGFGVSMVKKDNIKGLAPKRMFGLFEQGGNIDDIVAG